MSERETKTRRLTELKDCIINFRARRSLYDRLREAAVVNQRTLAGELDARLEGSFAAEDMKKLINRILDERGFKPRRPRRSPSRRSSSEARASV